MKLPNLLLAVTIAGFSSLSYAHEGHDHGEPQQYAGSGPIELTHDAIHNLDIQTIDIAKQQMEIVTSLYGVVVPDPKRHLRLTARFSGRVTEIRAGIGSRVQSGDVLLVAEPLQVGSVPVQFRAPFSGVITAQPISAIGQSFNSDQTLLELVDTTEVLVRGQTFEGPQAAKLKAGQKAYIITPLDTNHPIEAALERVSASINPDTLSFDVYARANNQDGKLLINSRVSLKVVTDTLRNRLAVPTSALLGEAGNYFVFILQGSLFSKRYVQIGKKAQFHVEILRGIKPGENVVTQGQYQLQYASPTKEKNVPDNKTDDHGHDHGHSHDQ